MRRRKQIGKSKIRPGERVGDARAIEKLRVALRRRDDAGKFGGRLTHEPSRGAGDEAARRLRPAHLGEEFLKGGERQGQIGPHPAKRPIFFL